MPKGGFTGSQPQLTCLCVSLSGTMWARAHRASWGSATGHNVSASVAVDCRRPRQPGQDHSVTEGEWVEPRECGLLDPAEELDQLVEEGQRRRSCCGEGKPTMSAFPSALHGG